MRTAVIRIQSRRPSLHQMAAALPSRMPVARVSVPA